MTFHRLQLIVFTLASKAIPTVKASRGAVAVCTAIVMAFNPARMRADEAIGLNISVAVGPVSATLDLTKPIMLTTAGATPVYTSTLHVHAIDNAQQPPFNADLIAKAQAADLSTLVGGFLPATIILKQDLLKGWTFQSAAADAQKKTGVVVTFFQDASLAEYGLLLALITVVCLAGASALEPTLRSQADAIKSSLMNSVCTLDLSSIGGSYGLCPTVIP